MDFNFGNSNEPKDSDEENNNAFSFNLDNDSADTNNSVEDNSAPFDWTPNETTASDQSEEDVLSNDEIFNDDNGNEEIPQFVPDVPDQTQEEAAADVEDAGSDFISDDGDSEQTPDDFMGEPLDEAGSSDADASEEQSEEDVFEETDEAESNEEQFVAEDAEGESEAAEGAFDSAIEEVPASAPAALDKRVRTPDGEQEYLLSELIDVETGEPLDLTSLIPEELLTAAAPEAAVGFSMGAAEPSTGGFDMSAGTESTAPSKRRRPARPKASPKKGGSIVGIIFGGLLAFILFPYVMALIEMTTGAQSNIPIPAPGIKSTYKYIPEWWPDWAMFVFPGRTTDAAADAPADKPADNPVPPVPEVNPADEAPAGDEVPADEETPADDEAPADEAPADDAAAADDGAFDPDAFLGNDGAEANAQPEDVLADEEPAADEPAEPGVVNAPQYTSADVSEAVANVGAAFKAAKAIDDTVYAALNDMAEKSTFVDTTAVDDQLKDAMNKVRTAMGKFGTQAALATSLSEKWAARVEDEADSAGVLFVGSLTDVSERDGYQINTINIEGQDGAVEVVGLRKIKPAVGDKVVVCGKRIADPGKNLGGFTDNGKPVVWGGIVIKAENK